LKSNISLYLLSSTAKHELQLFLRFSVLLVYTMSIHLFSAYVVNNCL